MLPQKILKIETVTYRVGSVNFSRRKLGHAHDNSAGSENVAGARERSVHAHLIFRFENGHIAVTHKQLVPTQTEVIIVLVRRDSLAMVQCAQVCNICLQLLLFIKTGLFS